MQFDKNYDTMDDASLKAEVRFLLDEYKRLGDLYMRVQAAAQARYGSWQMIPTFDRRALLAIQLEQFEVDGNRSIVDTVLNREGHVGGVGGIPTYPVDPSTGQPTGPDTDGNPAGTPWVPPVPQPGDQRDPGDES